MEVSLGHLADNKIVEILQMPGNQDPDEYIRVVTASFDDAREMIRDGRIIDAKTALGIHLAAQRLKRPARNAVPESQTGLRRISVCVRDSSRVRAISSSSRGSPFPKCLRWRWDEPDGTTG